MSTLTTVYSRRRNVPIEMRTSTKLDYAEQNVAARPDARALLEQGRTSFTEFTVPAGMTLDQVASSTLGDRSLWTVLAVLNRDIPDICDIERAWLPGLVLRIPTSTSARNGCEPDLPPNHQSSTHAAMQQSSTTHSSAQTSETSPMQTVCNARTDRAAKRMELLERIVASFELMAYAGAPTPYLGLEDARAVTCAAKNAFPPSVVRVAHDMLRDPDAVSLADWTSPWIGPHAHDATNDKEEYVRAVSLMKMRGDVSWLCDQVLAHFDDIACGKPSLTRAALAAWTPCMHMLTRKLGTPGDAVPQTDLINVLVQASNRNESTGDVVTREGVLRLQALLNGKPLPH